MLMLILVLMLVLALMLLSLSLLAKVGESLRAELSAARVKRAASCGAQRRSSLLQFTNYRIIATGGF